MLASDNLGCGCNRMTGSLHEMWEAGRSINQNDQQTSSPQREGGREGERGKNKQTDSMPQLGALPKSASLSYFYGTAGAHNSTCCATIRLKIYLHREI